MMPDPNDPNADPNRAAVLAQMKDPEQRDLGPEARQQTAPPAETPRPLPPDPTPAPAPPAASPGAMVGNPGETPDQTLARYTADYHSPDRAAVLAQGEPQADWYQWGRRGQTNQAASRH